jgi:hypothetical protein
LDAAIERGDIAFLVIIDAPQNPLAIRVRNAGNDEAVSVAEIRVNANAASKIQNPSRSKRF